MQLSSPRIFTNPRVTRPTNCKGSQVGSIEEASFWNFDPQHRWGRVLVTLTANKITNRPFLISQSQSQIFSQIGKIHHFCYPFLFQHTKTQRPVRLSESLYTVKGVEEHAARVDELNRLAGSTASESSCLVAGFHEAKKLDMIGKPNVRYSGRVLNRSMDSVLSGHTIYINSDISVELNWLSQLNRLNRLNRLSRLNRLIFNQK
ncbi:hypothetical protein ES332_D07G193200v1 [Gossypium tomentosum]|uniref:Uncharacterized protein n=1 Tax=Gossypium tomentosum TaxID=34277 RepID=A0A5D2KA16_GOSTO|nr:hypothetical protein ES332_D07G193200v1 [Gossypium tomentosum]